MGRARGGRGGCFGMSGGSRCGGGRVGMLRVRRVFRGFWGEGFRGSGTGAGCESWVGFRRMYVKIFGNGDRVFNDGNLGSGDLKGDWFLWIDSSRACAIQKRCTDYWTLESLCCFSVLGVHIYSVCSSRAGLFSFLRCQLLVTGA